MRVDLGVVGVLSLDGLQGDLCMTVSTLAAMAGGMFSNVVVCCSTLLFGCVDRILKVAGHVSEYCDRVTIMSNVSEAAHNDANPHVYSEVCYRDIEQLIQVKVIEKTGKEICVTVKHLDIPCMMIGTAAFVFPRNGSASFLQKMEHGDTVQSKLMVTAHLLSSVARILDVQPEAFCLGPLAEGVGRGMSFIPAHDSTSGKKAAFCIVDRALDTATPSTHSRFLIQQITSRSQGSSQDSRWTARPSLFHPTDPSANSYLDFLISKTSKESSLFIRKWLKEAIRDSNLKFTGRLKPGSVSADDLRMLSSVLASDSHANTRYSSLLQMTELACESMDYQCCWSEFEKSEGLAKLSAEDGPESLCSFILDELASAEKGLMKNDGVFEVVQHLMMGCYWIKIHPHFHGDEVLNGSQQNRIAHSLTCVSISCFEKWREQGILKERIGDDMPWLAEEMKERVVSSDDFESLKQEVQSSILKDLVHTICTFPAQYESDGIQQQVLMLRFLDDILSGRKIPGLKHIGTSIAGLLKSGLGRIGIQQHSPGGYELIIIFMLGGISSNEIAEVKSYIDFQSGHREMPHILLGGSSLLHDPSLTLSSIFSE
jgi:hypothetical protein